MAMTDEELENLVSLYSENKKTHDSWKKIVDAQNSDIKTEMLSRNLDEFVAGNLTAKINVQNRETLDEEKLIKVLTNLGFSDLIKMIPTVDMNALEEAIYTGKLTDAQVMEIGKCKESKEVVTLRVSKTKKKEEE